MPQHFGLKGFQLALDMPQTICALALEQGHTGLLLAVLRGGAILGQCLAGRMQLPENGLPLGGWPGLGQLKCLARCRQRASVNGVCLGLLPESLRKAPRLQGIDS